MAIVEGGAGMSYTDIMRYGYSRDQAKDLEKLAQVYYRRTNYSRVQAASVATAHATAKSLDELLLIEKQVKKLKNKKNAWPMRKALTAVRGHAGDIRREAKRLIEAWNPHVDEDTDATPKAHFCDVKNTLRRKLVLEADEHTLRQKELEARKLAQKCGITLGEAVVKLLVEGGPVAPARTTIIVGLEAGTKIERARETTSSSGLPTAPASPVPSSPSAPSSTRATWSSSTPSKAPSTSTDSNAPPPSSSGSWPRPNPPCARGPAAQNPPTSAKSTTTYRGKRAGQQTSPTSPRCARSTTGGPTTPGTGGS